jgi:DNA-binding FadR family transcriptional regulator
MSRHEEIAEALTRDVLVGQYRVGERLPSERDLAARFEANRGAVREAMKKLEQLGIADIQPGGARVAPLNEANVDVLGYLLAIDAMPRRTLLDQILVVIDSLVQTAALAAIERMDDDELTELRAQLHPIWAAELDPEAHAEARMNLFRALMAASGNLPVQLIAKSLLTQLQTQQMDALSDSFTPDLETHRRLTRQVDEALAGRDASAIRASFTALSQFVREQMHQAIDAVEASQQSTLLEATGS